MRAKLFRNLWIVGLLLPLFVSDLSIIVNSWWGFFPAAFLFLSFSIGLFSWGSLCATVWQRNSTPTTAEVFLFSSAVAVAFSMITGHLGFLGSSYRWAYSAFLILGLLLAPNLGVKNFFFLFDKKWLNGVFLFVLGLRFFSAYLPQAHGDPLLYHLEAPRLWNLMGRVQLNHDLPVPLLAATWEYFYLWPQVIFASGVAAVKELVLAQIFSQWIHLLWGWWGGAIVLRALLRRREAFSSGLKATQESWEAVAMLALLFVSSMQWTGALAKNDCGMAFWCLGAWLFLQRLSKKDWRMAGLFAGFAVSAKINAILFVIPLVPAIFYFHGKKNLSRSLSLSVWGVLGFIVGAGPVYFRNWWETKDPFFTMFAQWFPSPWISQSWADHFMGHQPESGGQLLRLAIRFHELLKESPAYWLWILLVPAIALPSSRALVKKMDDWILLFISSVVVCVVAVPKDSEPRYLGASLWVGAVLGVYFLFCLTEKYSERIKKTPAILCIVALLAFSKLPTHFLWKFFRTAPGEAYVHTHTAGRAKAWLRDNVKNGELVVVSGDNESYYLSTIRSAVLTERPDIDAATYKKKDFSTFLAGLCESSGARYLLDVRASASLTKRYPSEAWDKAVFFSDGDAKVFNLVKLQELVLKKDKGCGHS